MRPALARLACALVVLGTACTVPMDTPDDGWRDAQIDAQPATDAGPPPDDAAVVCDPESSRIGESCETDDDCSDACFCNGAERCVEGTCAAGDDPCTDVVPEDAPSCVVPGCVESARACAAMPDHAQCDDGEPCNGDETCSASLGCVAGEEPACDDDDACTIDSCEVGVGCAHDPRDLDLDGHPDVRCGGDDCDDDPRTGAETYPGVGELCTNRRDDDCDGALDFEDDDCVPTNDDCASAEPLPPGDVTVSGTTRGLDADIDLTCAPAGGGDAVYRIQLAEHADLHVEARSGNATISVALRPLDECISGPDLRCSTRVGPSFLARNVAPGDYAIIVRTPLPAPFTLIVDVEPPSVPPQNETCGATTDRLQSGVTVSGRFDEVRDDVVPACREDGGLVADAVYRLQLDAPSDVAIHATAGGSSLYVSLVEGCDAVTDSLACVVDGAPIVRRRGLAAGTYFVVVEPADPTVVTYQLTAQITPAATPAPGDACGSAIDVPVDGRVVIPVASLLQDGGTSCGGASGAERDAVLRLTLAQERDVTVTATTTTGHASYVALRTECDEMWSELACRAQPLTTRALAAGTYALVVTTAATSGDLTIDVETSAPSESAPGDHCEAAIDVSAGARIDATFEGAGDDLRAGTCASFGRPDAFYRLSLATERRVLVFAESLVPGLVSVSLHTGGCAGPELLCRNGTTAAFERVLPAGEHFLAVEGDQTTPGAYRLRVLVEAP
ncbi:hypothetical protein [Sandaracinus amylolyticus]|uniref:hypothetical protein n=1 Tax=Sandaracinus amylolyticus TaxID=927083 RepID=UPI001F1837B0|nr:hypothetical protein [Sandaracinus amylolyticus]UJR85779.1 Hypothetical protein I5071_78590 [Sandaracinus amylolyticus]